MIDPYRMVVVNIIASALLFTSLLMYRFFYPKRKINLFFLLIAISLLPLLSLLRKGDYESGDFNIHVYRIMSFYDSLKEGQLIPSWAGELNATYGNPLFIFNYSLPYYGVSFFHFIGFSFITSMKIYLGLMYFISGIFMYTWIKKLTNDNFAAFIAGIFYLFSPYHLVDFHFRATLGEMTVFAIAPLVFLFVTKFIQKNKLHWLVLISLSTILLSLGHPLLAIPVIGMLTLFSMLLSQQYNKPQRFFLSIGALFIGSLASLHLWIPFIIFAPYMYPHPSGQLIYYSFSQLFYSPWMYGLLFQGPHGELSLIIGYAQIIVVLISIILLIKKKIPANIWIYYIFWIVMFLLFLFLMSPQSKFIWNYFPIFWMYLPYGRLLLPTAICTSVITAYFSLVYFKKHRILLFILVLFTIGSTILNWGHRRVIPAIDDRVLRNSVWKSTAAEGPTAYFLNNKWADINNFWFSELSRQHLEILKGKAHVKELIRTSIRHTYIINAETPITLKENTLYFPGWFLTSNEKLIPIYPGKRGVIHANLPQGLQYIELKYEDLPVYKILKIISIGMFVVLLFSLLINRFLLFKKR